MSIDQAARLECVIALRTSVAASLEQARAVRELLKGQLVGLGAAREACDALKAAEEHLRELQADLAALVRKTL